MPVPIIEVDDSEDLTCPTCGQIVLSSGNYIPQPACPHVEFLLTQDYPPFEYIDPAIEASVEKQIQEGEERAEANEEDFEPLDVLQALPAEGRNICRRTEYGIACGPVSYTVFIGFNSQLGQPAKP